MKCSVFIATSADGFIAKKDGDVNWLHEAGKKNIDLGDEADMGFKEYLSHVDCLIMGRKCMDAIAKMNFTSEQWPYGDIRIIVLSNHLKSIPESLPKHLEIYSGDIKKLLSQLENDGHQHAYIDGGTTIQGFISEKLIQEVTITKAPIILGSGIPLFGDTNGEINLINAKVKAFKNDFIQEYYEVSYD